MINLQLSQNRHIVKCNQKDNIFVSIEVSPDESTQLIQKTHHVSLAIDCSGSMYGEPLDDAKNAAIQAVKNLSPNDMVSIVAFEQEARVELSAAPANDSNISNVINSLEPGGGTAMYDGINMAFNLLQKSITPNIINKLMVFTDGEPTVGPDDNEIIKKCKEIRNSGISVDVFGIGIDYNENLTKGMSEAGGGKWEHVENTKDLQVTVIAQMTEMLQTVISNPQLELSLMQGAELAEASMIKPTYQEINLKDHQVLGGNKVSFGIKDIIIDQSQIIAMRISVPPIQSTQPVSLVTARITEGGQEIAIKTAEISCSDDPTIYNLEASANPRVLFQSGKATQLIQDGIANDDDKATVMAKTIIKSLESDATSGNLSDEAQATVINAQELGGNLKPEMTDAQKKSIMHQSTQIGNRALIECPSCHMSIKPGAKFCGKCGKPINNQEDSQ